MPAYPYFDGVTPATAQTLPTVVISGVTASYVPPDVWNQVMRQFEYVEVDVNHQNHNVAGVNVLTAVTANITTLNLSGALSAPSITVVTANITTLNLGGALAAASASLSADLSVAGKVNIGAVSAVTKLHLFGVGQSGVAYTYSDAGNHNATIYAQSSDGDGGSGGSLLLGAGNGSFAYVKAWLESGTRTGALVFGTNPDSGTTLYERMRISSAGNVGIGTPSPAAKLHLYDATRPEFRIDNGSTGKARIGQATAGARLDLTTNAWYNGSSWVRDDDTLGGVVITLNSSVPGGFLRTFAPGSGSITWSEMMAWNLSGITLNGATTLTGALDAAGATFSGAVSASSATISGNLTVTGSIINSGLSQGVYDVTSYGAVGDGTTNDTAAIQAAIDAAEATLGGVVFFPSGKTYKCGSVTIQKDKIVLMGYGATIIPASASISVFHHNANNGGFSYFGVAGLKFVGTPYSGLNGIKAIHCQGSSTAALGFITVRDCQFEDVQYAAYIDRCNDVLIDNLHLYGQSTVWAGSTSDTGAVAYSHRVNISNLFYHPPGAGNPSFGAVLTLQRVAGGSVSKVMFNDLRGVTDGIHILNDTQGVTIEAGLVIRPANGVLLNGSNMGIGTRYPLMNQMSGLQLDQYTNTGITVGVGAYETNIKDVVITGQSVATTENHGVLNFSDAGTTVVGCRFQNINKGNGIYVGAGRTLVKNNRFWCAFNGACINVASGLSNVVVADNYRDPRDASANYISTASVITNRNND